jgi:hypothetical protein
VSHSIKDKLFPYLHQNIYIISKEYLEQKKIGSSMLDEGSRKSDHPEVV